MGSFKKTYYRVFHVRQAKALYPLLLQQFPLL